MNRPPSTKRPLRWLFWIALGLVGTAAFVFLGYWLLDALLAAPLLTALIFLTISGSVVLVLELKKSQRLKDVTLDRFTLVLAVSAIIFAVVQFVDSRLQEARIEKLVNELSTRFIGTLTYSRTRAKHVEDQQFLDYDRLVQSRFPYLIDFCNRHNKGIVPRQKSEFDALMFRKYDDYMRDLMDHGVQIRVTDSDLPFYLWNEDDQEAVVAFVYES